MGSAPFLYSCIIFSFLWVLLLLQIIVYGIVNTRYKSQIINHIYCMHSLLSELEGRGFVLPDYKKSSLEVAKQLAKGSGEFVGDKERKVFFIIDGLGHNLIEKAMKRIMEEV